jgi:hypothetical protein
VAVAKDNTMTTSPVAVNLIELPARLSKAPETYLEASHPDKDNPKAPLWIGTHGLNHRSSVTRMLEKVRHSGGD